MSDEIDAAVKKSAENRAEGLYYVEELVADMKSTINIMESIQSCGVHYDAKVTASSSFAGRKPEWR